MSGGKPVGIFSYLEDDKKSYIGLVLFKFPDSNGFTLLRDADNRIESFYNGGASSIDWWAINDSSNKVLKHWKSTCEKYYGVYSEENLEVNGESIPVVQFHVPKKPDEKIISRLLEMHNL
jgi:hypothetical protein